MALTPLTNECPAPPFNDQPVTSDLRFSPSWMRFFTRQYDWLVANMPPPARLLALEARADDLAAQNAALAARITALGG